ncbi:unnamed protein product [Didymodactylos carnosus]|uniref:Uncharacterized protein n=1 Tax=Didymodactylos carnosus TaxID=1234261 RepID=A0A814EN53_9BILA|nr:unnamed protein product [Didymodactylos carnosus]CAF3743362.1 unnamed protein product [Didymodactylos carnosus]
MVLIHSAPCVSSNPYYNYVSFVLLCAIIIPVTLFIIEIYQQFSIIIRLHSTISGYCSDPRGYGSRLLLCITFLIGYVLVNLLIEEQQQQKNMLKFLLQSTVSMCLPLVGIFYTRGKGLARNEYFQFGITRRIPIFISELIHVVAALGWVFVFTYFNLEYSISLLINKHYPKYDYVYFTLSCLVMLLTILFIIIQCIIMIHNSDHVSTEEFYCPDCTTTEAYEENRSFFTLNESTTQILHQNACRRCFRLSPMEASSLTNDGQELRIAIVLQAIPETNIFSWIKFHICCGQNRYIRPSSYIKCHVISFILELVIFFGTAGLAIGGCFMRKYENCL